MPRTRSNPLNLPPRVYQKHGTFWYVDQRNKWHKLGREWNFDARAKWNELVSDGAADTRLNVKDLLDAYIAHGKARWADRTYAGYVIDATKLGDVFGIMAPDEVSPRMVQEYLDRCAELGRGTHGNREIALLKAAYNWGIPRERCSVNPCARVRFNEETARERLVPLDELDRFCEFARKRTRQGKVVDVVSDLGYLLAQAKANVLKLRRADCDDAGIHVIVGKTKVRVCVMWSDRLRDAYQRAMALHDTMDKDKKLSSIWLIPNMRGQRYSIDGYGDLFSEVMKDWVAAGNEHFRPHDLRAGGATKLLNDGNVASDTTGHKLESTLKKHYDRRSERKGKPAA